MLGGRIIEEDMPFWTLFERRASDPLPYFKLHFAEGLDVEYAEIVYVEEFYDFRGTWCHFTSPWDPICGHSNKQSFITSNWSLVTCRRCLHKH